MALTEGRLLSSDLLLFCLQMIKMLIVVVVTYSVCWLPFNIYFVRKLWIKGLCKVIHPKYYKHLKKRCSPKPEILNKIKVQILTLNFQVNLEYFFIQKTCKMKIITHSLNHDLIFYCTHNQLSVLQ